MTTTQDSIMLPSTHINHFLNEVHKHDAIFKILTNYSNDVPMWISQNNHLNLFGLLKDIRFWFNLLVLWEGKWLDEKYNKALKKFFSNTKGEWSSNVIRKIHEDKLLSTLTDANTEPSSKNSSFHLCLN